MSGQSDQDSMVPGWARDLGRCARILFEWICLSTAVGIACGIGSAIFLRLLERVTDFRTAHGRIIYLLPLAGFGIGLLYERWGKSIRGGNNLVLDAIHEHTPQIPLRMAPMVLLGTVFTHAFGGSAGREGTAVQIGASLADGIAHRFRVGRQTRQHLLAAGIAGGFGSVFGTPIAGTMFGLEVVCIGRIESGAMVPAMIASIVGDWITRHLGVIHTTYPTLPVIELSPLILAKLVMMAGLVAGTAAAFVELTHGLKHFIEARVPRLPIRMFLGGSALVVMGWAVESTDYFGLGVPMIVRSFGDPNLAWYAFLAKLVFTAVTLASGFLGGEVTPLFFVGATLGNLCARVFHLPLTLGAGIGLAGVFGAAANTPIALSIMAVELLGTGALPHAMIVCTLAYLFSGHRGLYPAQRLAGKKRGGTRFPRPVPLREIRERPIGATPDPNEDSER